MWFVWNGLTVMAFNKEGWFYERGKGPSEELKEQIIDKILETGGDGILGYFPAKWTKLGDKFGVSDHGKPSRVNPSFRSPLQARGGIFSDHVTLFFRSHDHNRTASDSNFQRQFYHSTGFDSKFSPFSVSNLKWNFVFEVQFTSVIFIYLFIYFKICIYIAYIQVLEQKDITSPTRFNHLTQPQRP